MLVERYATLGGVCLNVGCIPSKALLHAAAVVDEAAHAKDFGITFDAPKIDLDKLRSYKDKVVGQLTKGLAGMPARTRSSTRRRTTPSPKPTARRRWPKRKSAPPPTARRKTCASKCPPSPSAARKSCSSARSTPTPTRR